MPPKAKITREMIVDAGFEIVRSIGMESINARILSKKLGCSTQPIMYHFKTIEDLKKAIFKKVDEFHSEYIMNITSDEPMKDIGVNYIRFAETEKNLFKLLFQSDELSAKSINDLISPENIQPILEILSQAEQVDLVQAKKIFLTLALFVHGYASFLANNSLEYDESKIIKQLDDVYMGATCAAKIG